MKRAKLIIISFLAIAGVFSFSSCEDDIVRDTTHTTNVSELVAGSYTGTITLDSLTSYSNVTVVLSTNDEYTEAVSVTIHSDDFTYSTAQGLDLPLFYDATTASTYVDDLFANVAVANDEFVFTCCNSAASKLDGRLNDDDLYMVIPILVLGTKTIFHTNGTSWYFNGTKD